MDGSDSCMIGKEVMRHNYDDVELTHSHKLPRMHIYTRKLPCTCTHTQEKGTLAVVRVKANCAKKRFFIGKYCNIQVCIKT